MPLAHRNQWQSATARPFAPVRLQGGTGPRGEWYRHCAPLPLRPARSHLATRGCSAKAHGERCVALYLAIWVPSPLLNERSVAPIGRTERADGIGFRHKQTVSSHRCGSLAIHSSIHSVNSASCMPLCRRYRHAAEGGNVPAQANVGWCYEKGVGGTQVSVRSGSVPTRPRRAGGQAG